MAKSGKPTCKWFVRFVSDKKFLYLSDNWLEAKQWLYSYNLSGYEYIRRVEAVEVWANWK